MTLAQELAVIDLGSNTVHLSIYAIDRSGYRKLYEYDESAQLRLIDELDRDGNLTVTAVDAIINVLNGFKGKCLSARLSLEQIDTVATSAIRSASNRLDVVARIEAATQLTPRILTAEQEARYASLGIMLTLGLRDGLVFDLGAGGLQVASLHDGDVAHAQGFLLGTRRLLKRFPAYAPMSPGQIESLRDFVGEKFRGQQWMRESLAGGTQLVGIGGTVRALARVEHGMDRPALALRGYAISAEALDRRIKTLSSMTVFQLLTLKGMDANRIDMVLFGAIIVRELMTASGAMSLIVCDTSIRDGLALEALMARKNSNESQLAR